MGSLGVTSKRGFVRLRSSPRALAARSLPLIKIAARVIETARSVRLAFAACHPEAELFASLPGALAPLGP
jgi:hypothetical protein